MHILMLSDWETRGGAGTAASRLADALGKVGHAVTRVVAMADQKSHTWQTIENKPSIFGLAARHFLPDQAADEFLIWERKKTLQKILEDIGPDVINVHNLHSARRDGWSYPLLQVCDEFAPAVWTLHDMWSFTGRCAYNVDCYKFRTGCDASCPTPEEYPRLAPNRIAAAWLGRQELFNSIPKLAAITPSKWLAEQARTGFWKDHRIEWIPNGLPLEIYKPVDRSLARQALDMPPSDPCIMTAALRLTERRKGFNLLVDAMRQISSESLTLLTLGADPINIDFEGVNIHHLGYLDHERTKVLAYSAADIYVHPAFADNLPNTVMEAIACGTPVVGFPIGGVPEMVRSGISGWLAEAVSSEALADTLTTALNDIRHDDLRNSCRALAETEYDDRLQAQRYVSLFETLIRTDLQ